MVQFTRCNLQHTGERKIQRLKYRSHEHRRAKHSANTEYKPTTAPEHFLSSPHHTANDIQLISFEKTFSSRHQENCFVLLINFWYLNGGRGGGVLIRDGTFIRGKTKAKSHIHGIRDY